MTKLYVVYTGRDYEEESLESIWDTEEAAINRSKELEDNKHDYFINYSSYEEFDLNTNTKIIVKRKPSVDNSSTFKQLDQKYGK